MTERWVSPVEHDRTRPNVIFRFRMLTGNDRTLRSSVRSLHISVSGHHLTIEIGWLRLNAERYVARIA